MIMPPRRGRETEEKKEGGRGREGVGEGEGRGEGGRAINFVEIRFQGMQENKIVDHSLISHLLYTLLAHELLDGRLHASSLRQLSIVISH